MTVLIAVGCKSYGVAVKYDEYDDVTRYAMLAPLAFGVAMKDEKPDQYVDKTVDMAFYRGGDDWVWLKCRSIRFLADGERWHPEQVRHDGDVESYGVREVLIFEIPKGYLKALVEAENSRSSNLLNRIQPGRTCSTPHG